VFEKALLVLAVLVLLAIPDAARADGDPASDVLYTQDVFVPYPPPSPPQTAALRRSVSGAYAKRYRVKVAVIAAASDLGAVPELFGKPTAYAKFLGQELSPVYVGPLLIVMRAGYGIYDGGRPTAAEEHVLAALSDPGSSANDLTSAATAAVRRLTSTGALHSKDIKSPLVYPRPTSGKRGQTVRLSYSVLDDSERTRETVRIARGTRLLGKIKTRLRQSVYARPHSVTWRVPKSLSPGPVRFCIVATDAAGNASPPACTYFTVR
jgi:hypothetical protein